jgi:hypothetical protein
MMYMFKKRVKSQYLSSGKTAREQWKDARDTTNATGSLNGKKGN